MRLGHSSHTWTDENGNDVGGVHHGFGFTITWQNGPLKRDGKGAPLPTGAFVEDVLEACKGRLQHYQEGNFPCPENEVAIAQLVLALDALDQRTKDREARGVEGSHQS